MGVGGGRGVRPSPTTTLPSPRVRSPAPHCRPVSILAWVCVHARGVGMGCRAHDGACGREQIAAWGVFRSSMEPQQHGSRGSGPLAQARAGCGLERPRARGPNLATAQSEDARLAQSQDAAKMRHPCGSAKTQPQGAPPSSATRGLVVPGSRACGAAERPSTRRATCGRAVRWCRAASCRSGRRSPPADGMWVLWDVIYEACGGWRGSVEEEAGARVQSVWGGLAGVRAAVAMLVAVLLLWWRCWWRWQGRRWQGRRWRCGGGSARGPCRAFAGRTFACAARATRRRSAARTCPRRGVGEGGGCITVSTERGGGASQ